MSNYKYIVKFHQNSTETFLNQDNRPFVKRILEETFVLPQKELVIEQVHSIMDIPYKRISDARDLDISLRSVLSEKEEREFIEKNNLLFDAWHNQIKHRIEEWIALYAERENSNFKHFTINLDQFSWDLHELDVSEDEDTAYIDISVI